MRYWYVVSGLLWAAAGHATARAAVHVGGVAMRREGSSWRLDVKASAKTPYTVHALSDPDRLIIDLPGATLATDSQVQPLSVAPGAPTLRYSQFTRRPDAVRIVVDMPSAPSWREISASPAMNISLAFAGPGPALAPSRPQAQASPTPARRSGRKASSKPAPTEPVVLSARQMEQRMREAGVTSEAAPPPASAKPSTHKPARKARRAAPVTRRQTEAPARSSVTSRDGFVDRSDLLPDDTASPDAGMALPPVPAAPVVPAWTPEEAIALINSGDCPDPLRRRLIEIVSDPAVQTSHYVWGAETPGQFDCSGLALYVYSGLDVKLPRVSWQQAEAGVPVEKSDLRPGDLVFFNTRGASISHVGIYLGGGRFLHAANRRANLQITALDDIYYAKRYVTARRIYTPVVASSNIIRQGG